MTRRGDSHGPILLAETPGDRAALNLEPNRRDTLCDTLVYATMSTSFGPRMRAALSHMITKIIPVLLFSLEAPEAVILADIRGS